MKMILAYCDASFNCWAPAISDFAVGEICVWINNWILRENVSVQRVDGLRQYNNVFEFLAIARTLELATEQGLDQGEMRIHSDSQIAVAWAKKGIRQKILTATHAVVLARYRRARAGFGGTVKIEQIPREQNYAGHVLEGRRPPA